MPRFAIKHLMIAIGVVGVLLAAARAYGPSVFFPLMVGSAYTLAVWIVRKRNPRIAGRAFAVASLISCLGTAWACALLFGLEGWAIMLLVLVLTMPFILGCGSIWVSARTPTRRLPNHVAGLLVFFAALIPASMALTSWPLHVAFAISKPSLERLADRASAGTGVGSPEWAGFYRIVSARIDPRNGNVALLTDANPNGATGFVRVTGRPPDYGPLVNLNFDVHLLGSWRFQQED